MEITEEDYDKIAQILDEYIGDLNSSEMTEEQFYTYIAMIIKTSYLVGYDKGLTARDNTNE